MKRREYLDRIQELQDDLDKETNLTDNDIKERLRQEETIAVREIQYEIEDLIKLRKIYKTKNDKAR